MSDTKQQQETITDALKRLEQVYLDHVTASLDINEQLLKVKEQLMTSQNDEYRSYQKFTGAKEQYLVNVIKDQNTRLLASTPLPAVTTPLPAVAELVEPRNDNIDLTLTLSK